MSLALRRLDTRSAGFDAELARLAHWLPETDRAIEERVTAILEDVRTQAATTEAPLRLAGDIHACSGVDCDCLRHLAVHTMPASAAHPAR